MRSPKFLLVAGLTASALAVGGCSRAHYRNSADDESYPILRDREALDPAFAIGRLRVEPPPGSRLADPYDPDHPPKPPDDPASAVLMAHPYKFKGYSHWGKDGYANGIEPPDWERSLPFDANGILKLDAEKAAQIALLHSRDYQTNLESVYELALSLTLNRFDFDMHWFANNGTNFTHFGAGGAPTETNTLASNTAVGFTQNLAAGGQFMAEFLNNLVYQYTGGGSQFGSSAFFSLSQPLLRGFGRQIALESLTQAERNVLYSVRTFARYRKSFYVGVTAGGNNGVGYLGLLLLVQQLRNAEENLKQQEESYRLYSELFNGGRASVVDVDVIFQGLQTSRLAVVNARLALENSLDAFKIQLGLPPRLPIDLDDSPLNRFILTDPAADRFRDEIETFQRARLKELDAPPSTVVLQRAFVVLRGMIDRIPAIAKSAGTDLETFRRILADPARADQDLEQRTRDAATYKSLTVALDEVLEEAKKLAVRLEMDAAAVEEGKRKENWVAVTLGAKRMLAVVDAIIAVQTQSRIYTIELPDAGGEEAPLLEYAKQSRLDLQNALAQATDAWRGVTVAANALHGDLTFNASASLGTDPTQLKPFRFDAHGNTYTAGLQIDTPLNRQAERNAYRASPITYQQAKRAYVLLSDQIEQQVRQDLRQLKQLKASFGIARQQLLSAARQYENTRLSLVAPQDQQQRGGGGGTDTATLQLQTALSNLLSARNALAAAYINFEQQRLQLLLDLEQMQLDARGFPIDGTPRRPDPAAPIPIAPGGRDGARDPQADQPKFRPVGTAKAVGPAP